MTELERLIAVVPPPERAIPSSMDWHGLEGRLGTRLPGDYKALVETYGSGTFGGFLSVFQPSSRFEFVELETQIGMTLSALEVLEEFEDLPYRPQELLSVATTDNGNTVFWVKRPPAEPDSWSIVVNQARGDEWFSFPGGIVAFLAAVFVDRTQVTMFPDSLSERVFTFAARE